MTDHPAALSLELTNLRAWLPRMMMLWIAISVVGVLAVALGMAMHEDLPKIVGVAVVLAWTPLGGATFAYLGFKKRRQAALLEAFAADRRSLKRVTLTGVWLFVDHRDGRSLELDCGGMLVRDAEAIATYLKAA